MLHEYSNLYFPIASMIIALSICFLYFTNKNVKNNETKIYTKIVIITLIEAIYTFLLTLFVHLFFNDSTMNIFGLVNKILYSIYVVWISMLFFYFYTISDKKIKEKTLKSMVLILNFILIFAIFISPIELIYDVENKISNSYGLSANILFIGCGFYLFLMAITAFINSYFLKKLKKYVPFFVLMGMMTITLIIRVIDPYCNMTSNVISLITLLMYFTIENPDSKMVNQLELARNEAVKANQVKSEFIASMSHEIRTPLNAIVGFSELIEYSDSLEEAKENSKEIINSSNTLLNMISNVLDIALVDANTLEINECPYNLGQIVENVLDLYKYRIEEKNLAVIKEFEEVPKILIGDARIIKRVFSNLVDNAIKYTKEGTITIAIKCSQKNDICHLEIIVKDTGIGIDKTTLEHLFENFNRASIHKDSNISGFGLGLAISKNLLELIGGKISCESKVGEFTEFKIKIKQKVGREDEGINS